jgi:hypothetical protein
VSCRELVQFNENDRLDHFSNVKIFKSLGGLSMNKKLGIGILGVSILSVTVLFQNCGGQMGQGSSTLTSLEANPIPEGENPQPSDPDPIPEGETPTLIFKAGEKVSSLKLPYKPSEDFKKRVTAYLSYKGFKAIAMAENGIGVAQTDSAFTSQKEANDIMLERCQLLAGNMPCALLAEGNLYKYNEDDFYKARINVLESGKRKFNAITIPGLAHIWRTHAAGEGYMTRKNKYKAYAIGHYGATSPGWGEISQQEANRRAVEFCETISLNACTLYAVGNDVVFNVSGFSMSTKPVLKFSPSTFSVTMVPFISEDVRTGATGELKNVPDLVKKKKQVVVTLSRYGHYRVEVGTTMNAALISAALDNCNKMIAKGSPFQCFIYSKNLDVVFTRATLEASLRAK